MATAGFAIGTIATVLGVVQVILWATGVVSLDDYT
jgi:hypothetical protein